MQCYAQEAAPHLLFKDTTQQNKKNQNKTKKEDTVKCWNCDEAVGAKVQTNIHIYEDIIFIQIKSCEYTYIHIYGHMRAAWMWTTQTQNVIGPAEMKLTNELDMSADGLSTKSEEREKITDRRTKLCSCSYA